MSSSNTNNNGVFGNSLIDDATLVKPLTESPNPLDIKPAESNTQNYDPFAPLNKAADSNTNTQLQPAKPLEQPAVFNQPNIFPVTTQPTITSNNKNTDALTGNKQNTPLLNAALSDPLIGNSNNSALRTTATSSSTTNIPNFAIRSEGTVTVNGSSDFDGLPADYSDDALIYAGGGFNFNGSQILPVQRDALGNPIRDGQQRQVLVDKAVAVAAGYTISSGPSSQYAGLNPPQIVPTQTINVPAYADVRDAELARRIPTSSSTVTFNIAQNSIRNANDWNSKFPSAGTSSSPRVVRVTGGALEIPANVNINNYVIIVETGNISFKGNNQNLNNVVFVANNGNIDLGNMKSTNLAAFASGSITMNGSARFTGGTTLASGSSTGSIAFNGASTSINAADGVRAISQGTISFSGASNTRGHFTSAKDFTFNGSSVLYGTISAKGNVRFNGSSVVIYRQDPNLDTTPPVITASLEQDTARNNTTNTDTITSNPTIIGSVIDASAIVELGARFGSTSSDTSILTLRDASGNLRLTPTQLEQINGGALRDGTQTLKITAKDASGNIGNYEFTFTLDTTEPAPSNLDLTSLTDSGRSDSDNITNNTTPTITGNALAGANVQLFNSGQLIGQATADSTGKWQITSSTLTNGSYTLTATASDIAGNTSLPSQPLQIIIDTVAPVPPSNLKLTTATDTGTSNTDGITKNTNPTIIGSAEANSIVKLYKDGLIIGQTTAAANGEWSVQLTNLSNGQHVFTATATDVAGNISSPSTQYTITVDTQINPPSNLDLIATSDSGASNIDNITKATTPTITGNADVGSIVQLFNSGQQLGQATTDNDGKWSITTSTLNNGIYNLTAIATDIAGNISTPSTPLQITIDAALPSVTLTTPVDTQPLKQGAFLTGNVDGTGSSVIALQYRFDNNPTKDIPFSFTGVFNEQIDFTGISNSQHTLTIIATDTAGNIKTSIYNVTVALDNDAPVINASLQRDTAEAGATNNDKITFDPSITGTVTDASQVVEFLASFGNTPTTNVLPYRNANGVFSFDRALLDTINGGTLPDGQHTLKLQAKDQHGNISGIFELTFTLDTTTPIPTLNLISTSDTGFSNTDKITNDSTPTITGTSEAGATVQLYNGSQLVGETTANNSGVWQITTSELTDGVKQLSATVTDIAGNTNTGTPLGITVDTALPQLTLTTPLSQTTLKEGTKLSGNINGTGSPITAIKYRFNNLSEIPVTFNAAGTFDQQLDFTGLGNGTHTLTITATDTAGNTLTTNYNVTVNLTSNLPTTITASLVRDTAPNNTTNSDKITFDATIAGKVTNVGRVAALKGGFNNTAIANYINVLSQLDAEGNFNFNLTQLETIYGGILPDGALTLRLVAVDASGNTLDTFSYTFTLDTRIAQPIFNLDAASDSGTLGDRKTKFDFVTLSGITEPGATLILEQTGATTTADNTGKYSFTSVNLVGGDNAFTVRATDIAGNTSTFSTTIYRFSAPTAINLTNNTIAENSVVGKVIGELSSIDPDTGDTHSYTLIDNAGGRFKLVGNQLQVANGNLLDFETRAQHTVIVRSTDTNGLTKDQELTINVTNVNETPSFTSTPITSKEDATYTYNITTTDPDANDTRTISATNLPNWLTLTDNGNGTATLTGNASTILSDTNINLTVTDALGLTATQGFTITPSNRLVEGSNFTATRTIQLIIPATPSILTFKIDPIFDNFDTDSINDAFEVALVDKDGNSLVHTIAKGRDAFFNLTEGENAALGAGASYDDTTKTISLNLTGVLAGNANLIFRLVNNDSDTTTNVKITDFAITAAPAGTTAPTQTTFTPEIRSIAAPNFNVLVDVSNSLVASYNRTSFNAETKTLYADISIRNTGSYSVDVPVLVAVTNISDPSVLLRNPDGVTPDGILYYDFTSLVEKGKLNPNGESGERALAFYNPNNVQFTYDVVVLAQLNKKPVIDSKPVIEIIAGQQYKYSVKATDPNGDSVTYKLLTSAEGMTIEENTGLITWNTLSTNKGNQSVVVEVSDGRGGVETQVFTLSVIEAPPPRPPVFITNPKTDGRINTQYTYTARATDADNDNLTYSLVMAPTGMTVDSSTGVVSWKPNGNQLGTYDVILAVSDGKGGTAQQTFKVQTQIEQGNNAPIIISDPVTKAYNPTSTFDSVVFGLKSFAPGGSLLSTTPAKLFSFDVNGSNFRDLGTMTINGELLDADGLAVSEKYGLLGFVIDSTGSYLISIDPNTATAFSLGSHLLGREIRGAVFDLDDNLWAIDSASTSLLMLNPSNGSVLKSIALKKDGQPFSMYDPGTDIAIDDEGKFYLTAYSGQANGAIIYTLNPSTGVLTQVAADPWQYLNGITFASADTTNHLFAYEGNYEDEIFSYDVNSNYNRTVLFPNIIPEFNAGGGDLAAIVRKPRYSYTVKALDSDNDSLTYELVTAPIGMEINSSTGKITWANPVNSAIPLDVTVRVRDGRGGVDTQSFKLDTLTLDVSQIGGQVYVDDGQPFNQLVYFNDFEDPNRSNIEWSNPLLDTTPIGNRNFLGRYGGKIYSENLKQTQLSLNDLPEHETVTVSFKLFVNGSWGGSLGAFAPDTWKLNVVDGPTLLYTTFGSGYPGSFLPFRLPQAYPENFDDNNPSLYLYPGGTGAAEFNTLGYYLTDGWGDAVYNLSFTFEHGGSNLALDFIGGTDEDINNESWGLDDVEISVGRKPKTLSNWSVYLDSNNNNKRDVNEISTLTDDKGNYSFIVAPGNYTVATEVQPGWTTVQPTNSNYQITVNNNQAITNFNFGNRSSVTGSVAPSFLNTPPSKAMVGQKFNYRAVATDLNGDVLSYDLVVKPSGMVIDSNTGLVSWLPQTDQVGMQNIIVRVLDSNGNVTLQPFQVEVSPFNTAPKFTNNLIANNFEDLIAGVGQALNYQFTAIDAEGDPITYSLKQKPLGVTLDPTTGILSWAPSDSQIGLNNLLVTASDGKGGETTIPFDIRVLNNLSNSNPVISSTPRKTIALGQNYFYSVIANDANFDPLTISLENAPTGMTIDNQGRIFWNANKLGSNPVTIKVDDGRGGIVRQSFNIDVVSTIAKLNSAPSITSVPDIFVTNVGREYRYNLTGTDPDNDLLLWSLDAAPRGMTIDATSGALVWNPTANQIGEHTVAVRLTDALGQYVGTEFNLTVTGVNAAPQIVSYPVTIAAQNQQYTYTVVATDPENDALTYSLDSTSLTKGITIDSNGRIIWTPQSNQVGSHALTVTVSDAIGASNTQTYTIEVGTTAINNAPTITSTPKYVATVGSPYSYQIVATDRDAGDTLTYQILSKPAGVDIQINPTTGLLTWDNPIAGQYQIVVGAVDRGGVGAAQGFTLTARNNSNPVINSTAPDKATPGSIYAYDVKATDADGDNLTYSLDSVSKALGITVDALGRLRWAPNITHATQLPHQIFVTVNDGNGGSATQEIKLNVARDTEAPKVRLIALSDTANLGEDITFQARATDNVKVASLQLFVDGTPVVLDANGIVTVKASGTLVSAVAIATDTSGNTKRETFDVTVNDPSNTNPPTVSLQPLTVNDGFITAPTSVRGSISDDGSISYYKLLMAPVWAVDDDGDSDEFTLIKRVDNPTAITNGILGTLDPSLLQNDTYVVRLEVADSGGNTSYTDQTVDVTGDLKLGNFRLSFTDLTVPVTGIPITLTRTYDTLTSNTIDDFGYGWRMEFRDTDLRTSLGKPTEEDEILGYQRAFKDGTKVYITLPGGKREAFTFKPTLDRIFKLAASISGNSDALVYHPAFVADKGGTSTLTVKDTKIIKRAGSNEYVGFDAAGVPYNPADINFGTVYVLTTKEGIVYEIDARTGDLLTVTDTNGNKLTYSDAGITSSTGKQITFERDTAERITAVKDPMGYLIQYGYDSKGDLISVTDREGNVTRIEYNSERKHYLDKIIDPLGRTGVRNEYGEDGRLKYIYDVNGKPVEMQYEPNNSKQVVLDQLGNATIYEYDERGNILTEIDATGQITKRRYNDNNDVEEETVISDRSGSSGFTTKYTYDSFGNKLTIEDPLGNVKIMTYGENSRLLTETDALGRTTTNTYSTRSGNLRFTKDALGKITEYRYRLSGELSSVTNAEGKVTEFDYYASGDVKVVKDTLGNVTEYTYNDNGDKLTEKRYMTQENGTVRELLTTWTYDKNGRMKTMTDAENHTTTYEYDNNGRQTAIIDALLRRTEYKYNKLGKLEETIYPDNTPNNPNDNPREITRYDAAGRKIETIDKAGRSTRFVYDKVGRLIYTVLPDDTPDNPTVSPELWDNPKTETIYYTDGLVKAQIDELGNRTEFRYDAAGRQIEIIYADNTPATLTDNPRTKYVYNAAGQKIAETDALNRTTSFKYDDLGRLVKTEFQDKTSTSQEYDNLGRRVASVDQENKRTEHRYDDLGHLTGVKNALGDWTNYSYNSVGNLISITDALNHTTRYEYDGVGRRTATILPMSQRSTMTYDAVGNLNTSTDFNGRTTTYTYDPQNRISEKLFVDGSKVTYTYTPTELFDVVTFVDASGQTTATYDYDYDARDRQIKRTDNIGGVSRSISYTYDFASNRTSVTTASGTVNYTFDVRNRLDKVIENGVVTADYDYDAVSNVISTTFANGTQENRQYDDLNRLKYLENRQGNTILSSYKYTLDKVGNRSQVEENTGRLVEYTYDDLYRLTEEKITDAVNGSRVYGYTYDKVGNRKTKMEIVNGVTTITEYAYDTNDRLENEKVNQQIVVGYTYDNQGNTLTKMESGATTEYTWNYENRLIAAKVKNASGVTQQSMQYRYNDNGIRVASIVNGVETRYLVDEVQPVAQVMEEYSPNGTVLVKYVYGNDLISQQQANSRTFYHVDGLGSTRMLTDAMGTIVSTYNYEAFGEQLNSTSSVDNKYLFAGEQFDENLGDYYLRQRYYDTETGRFTKRDTYEGELEEPLTLHKYIYANDNPVYFIDPTGLSAGTLTETGAIFAILAILATIGYIGSQVLEKEELDKKLTFYRGTTYYDMLETVENQRINLERIIESQRRNGYSLERQGVYFSSQYSTASYYADLVGGRGRGGGPGVFAAIVPEKRFFKFVGTYGIAVEVPVPQPPTPGQTETIIPYNAIPGFETFADYIIV